MTSVLARAVVDEEHPFDYHVLVRVYAGPDAEHRAHLGTLICLKPEAEEIIRRLADKP